MKKSSPCIKLCQMDPIMRTCLGCGRTVQEIARWGRMNEFERMAIMAKLPQRRREMARYGQDTERVAAAG